MTTTMPRPAAPPRRTSRGASSSSPLSALKAVAVAVAVIAAVALLVLASPSPAEIPQWVVDNFKKASLEIDFLKEDVFRHSIARDNWFVFFGAVWCPHCMLLTPKWLEMQKRRKEELLKQGAHLAKVECSEAVDLCEGDENINGFPTIKVYHEGLYVEEFPGDAMNQTEIEEFIDGMLIKLQNSTFIAEIKAGGMKPGADDPEADKALEDALKAAKKASNSAVRGPKSTRFNEKGEITHLDASNFAQLTKEEEWFVMFHSPTCSHCIQFAPTWEKLAKSLAGKYNMAKLNCIKYEELCSQYDIMAYPTLKYLREPQESIEFTGLRTEERIMTFLKNLPLGPSFTAVSSAELTEVIKDSEVMLLYLYDYNSLEKDDLTNLAEFAATVPSHIPVYACPDPSVFHRFSLTSSNSPAIILFKDGGANRKPYKAPPTAKRISLDRGSSDLTRLHALLAEHGSPTVPRLEAHNAKKLLGAPNTTHVVIGMVDPTTESGHHALGVLRNAAVDWGMRAAEAWAEARKDKVEDRKRAEGFARFVDGMKFVWINAAEKEAYVARVYGVRKEDLPTFVVAHPEKDAFYKGNPDGSMWKFTLHEVTKAAEDALSKRLKPTYTLSYLTRVSRGKASLFAPVKDFLRANLVLTLAVAAAVGYAAFRFLRGRAAAAGSYLPVSAASANSKAE
ncbi:thioredoxin-like protein [Zopfochytrium polystomum]|nr:thioredoxin-like protein [Zopfochytrium polystomum]